MAPLDVPPDSDILSLTWPLLFTSTPVLRRKTTSSRQPSPLAHISPSDNSSTGWYIETTHRVIIIAQDITETSAQKLLCSKWFELIKLKYPRVNCHKTFFHLLIYIKTRNTHAQSMRRVCVAQKNIRKYASGYP